MAHKPALLAAAVLAAVAALLPGASAQAFFTASGAAGSVVAVTVGGPQSIPLAQVDMNAIKISTPTSVLAAGACTAATDGNAGYYIRFSTATAGTVRITTDNCGAATIGAAGDNQLSLYNALTFTTAATAAPQCLYYKDRSVDNSGNCAGLEFIAAAGGQYLVVVQPQTLSNIIGAQNVVIAYTGSGGTGTNVAGQSYAPTAALAPVWTFTSTTNYAQVTFSNVNTGAGGVERNAGACAGLLTNLPGIWIQLTFVSAGTVTVSTEGCGAATEFSPSDTYLMLYPVGGYPNGACAAGNDDVTNSFCARTTLQVNAGSYYLFIASAFSTTAIGNAGTTIPILPISVTYAASGNPNEVDDNTFSYFGSLAPTWTFTSTSSFAQATFTGVNTNNGEASTGTCAAWGAGNTVVKGIWVKVVFNVPGTVVFSTTGCAAATQYSSTDTLLALYPVANYGTAPCTLGNDNINAAANNYCSSITTNVVAFSQYMVFVGAASSLLTSLGAAMGAIPLSISYTSNPSNLYGLTSALAPTWNLANAQSVQQATFTSVDTTSGERNTVPCSGIPVNVPGIWLKLTFGVAGTAQVSTAGCGSTQKYDTRDNVFAVYLNAANGACVAANDDTTAGSNYCSSGTMTVQVGQTYFLFIAAAISTLTFTGTTIPSLPVTVSYSNTNPNNVAGTYGISAATAPTWTFTTTTNIAQTTFSQISTLNGERNTGPCTPPVNIPGVWVRLAFVNGGTISISTEGCGPTTENSDRDTVIAVYPATNYATSQCLLGSDDTVSSYCAQGTVQVVSGGQYFLFIGASVSAVTGNGATLNNIPLNIIYTNTPGTNVANGQPNLFATNAPLWNFLSTTSFATATFTGISTVGAERNTGACSGQTTNIPGVWIRLQFAVGGTVAVSTDGCGATSKYSDRDNQIAVYPANNYQSQSCILGNDDTGANLCGGGTMTVTGNTQYLLFIASALSALQPGAAGASIAYLPIDIRYTSGGGGGTGLPVVSGTNVAVPNSPVGYTTALAPNWVITTGQYAQLTWLGVNLQLGGPAQINVGGCTNANKGAVYAKFTPLIPGTVLVTTEGCQATFPTGPGDTVLTVYNVAGYPTPALGCVAENNDWTSTSTQLCARAQFTVVAGNTYLIAVSGQGTQTSMPTLPITVSFVTGGGSGATDVAPDSDNANIAYAPAQAPLWFIQDSTKKVNVQYTNVNLPQGTVDGGRCPGNEANWGTQRAIYARFYLGVPGTILVTTAGCNGNNVVQVYTDPYPGTGSTVGCVGYNDNGGGGVCGALQFQGLANTLYWVVITGFNQFLPLVPLDISYVGGGGGLLYPPPPASPPPPAFDPINDNIPPAKDPISATPWVISSQVRGAVRWASINLLDGYQADQGLCQRGKPAMWVRVLATETGRIKASLAGCISDQYLTVYDYSQYVVNNQVVALQNNVNCIVQDDNSALPAGSQCPELSWPVTAGQSFLVLITGSNGATFLALSPLEISWQPAGGVAPPPGTPTPAFSKATAALVTVNQGAPVIFFWNNINLNGTSGFDEGSCLFAKPAVWFKVQTQANGLFQISTQGCTSAGGNGGPAPIFNGPGDNVVAVYNTATYPPAGPTGTQCLAFNNDFGGSLCATVQFQAAAGAIYYVLTATLGGSNWLPYVPYELKYVVNTPPPSPAPPPPSPSPSPPSPTPPPPPAGPQPQYNLQTADTIVVPTGGRKTFQYTNVNLNAVQAATDVGQCGSVGKPALWIKVVPEATGFLLVSTAGCGGSDGGPGDTSVSIYEWAYDVNKPCYAYDTGSGGSFCGAATFAVRATQTYVVLLTGGGNNRIFPVLPVDMYYTQPPLSPPPSPLPSPSPSPPPRPAPSPSPDQSKVYWPSQTCDGVFEDLSRTPRYTLTQFVTEFQGDKGTGVGVVTRMCTNININSCPTNAKRSCCTVPSNLYITTGPQCRNVVKVTATPSSSGVAIPITGYSNKKVPTTNAKDPFGLTIPVGNWFPDSGRFKICIEMKGKGCNSPVKLCNRIAAIPAKENAGNRNSPGCSVAFENGSPSAAALRRCCLETVLEPPKNVG